MDCELTLSARVELNRALSAHGINLSLGLVLGEWSMDMKKRPDVLKLLDAYVLQVHRLREF